MKRLAIIILTVVFSTVPVYAGTCPASCASAFQADGLELGGCCCCRQPDLGGKMRISSPSCCEIGHDVSSSGERLYKALFFGTPSLRVIVFYKTSFDLDSKYPGPACETGVNSPDIFDIKAPLFLLNSSFLI